MLSKEMRIGQSAILALDDQRGSGQRQQGAYAVQRHTGVKGLGRGDRRNSFLPDGKGSGRTLLRASSRSRPVKISFMRREARSLRKRRGIMTQRRTHSSPFSFRAISQTAMSRKVSPMGRG